MRKWIGSAPAQREASGWLLPPCRGDLLPAVALLARRRLPAGSELTFAYGTYAPQRPRLYAGYNCRNSKLHGIKTILLPIITNNHQDSAAFEIRIYGCSHKSPCKGKGQMQIAHIVLIADDEIDWDFTRNLGRTYSARHLSVHLEVCLMPPSCLCTGPPSSSGTRQCQCNTLDCLGWLPSG